MVERRKDHEMLVRLLDGLDTLQVRYVNFTRRVLVGMALLAMTNVAALAIGGVLIERNSRSTKALCALRHDLESRVFETDVFLRQHPRGIPGIPAGALRTTLSGQRRTIAALHVVTCSKPPVTP